MGGGAGFLGGLASGFGQGLQYSYGRQLDREDQERELKVNQYNTNIKGLAAQMAQIKAQTDAATDPATKAKYQQQYDNLKRLQDSQFADQMALFHPNQGPGAMAHLGRMAVDHAKQFPHEMAALGERVWHHHGPEEPAAPAAPAAPGVPPVIGTTMATPGSPAASLQAMSNVGAILPPAQSPVVMNQETGEVATPAPQQPTQLPAGRQFATAEVPGIPQQRGGVPTPAARPLSAIQPEWQTGNTPEAIRSRMAYAMMMGSTPVNPYLQDYYQRMALPNMTPERALEQVGYASGGIPRPSAAERAGAERPITSTKGEYRITEGPNKGRVAMNVWDPAKGDFVQKLLPEGTEAPAAGAGGLAKTATERYVQTLFPQGATPQQMEWAMLRYNAIHSPETMATHEVQRIGPDGQVYYDTVRSYSRVPQGAEGDPYFGLGPPPPNADGSPANINLGAMPEPEVVSTSTSPTTATPAPTTTPTPAAGTGAADPETIKKKLALLVPGASPGAPKAGGGAPSSPTPGTSGDVNRYLNAPTLTPGQPVPATPAAPAPPPEQQSVQAQAQTPPSGPPATAAPRRGGWPATPPPRAVAGARKLTPDQQGALKQLRTDSAKAQQLVDQVPQIQAMPENTNEERVAKAAAQREWIGQLQVAMEHRYNQQAREQLVGHYGLGTDWKQWAYTRFSGGMILPEIFNGLVAGARIAASTSQNVLNQQLKSFGVTLNDIPADTPGKSQQEQDDENFLRQVK